jgi:3-dehydroquinate dehydratase type I
MFQGTLADQVGILSAAVRAGCQWVDVEIESVQKAGAALLKDLRPAKIIVSYHDFQKTPPLASTLRRMVRLPVQVVKIATHGRYLKDNLRHRRLLKAHGRHSPRLVALAMGASGIPSRLLSLLWGSAFTYASPLSTIPLPRRDKFPRKSCARSTGLNAWTATRNFTECWVRTLPCPYRRPCRTRPSWPST